MRHRYDERDLRSRLSESLYQSRGRGAHSCSLPALKITGSTRLKVTKTKRLGVESVGLFRVGQGRLLEVASQPHRKCHDAQMSGKKGFISLCSGCGGFDLGFTTAGFECLSAWDIDEQAIATFNRNLRAVAKQGDVTADGFEIYGLKSAQLLISGPPCQGFSTVGKQRADDPRNAVILRVAQLAAGAKVPIVLLENVPAITNAKNRDMWDSVNAVFRGSGYKTTQVIVDASQHGVAQIRRRALLLAWNTPREVDFMLGHTPALTLRQALSSVDEVPDHQPVNLALDSEMARIAKRIGPGQKLCDVRDSKSSVHTWDIPEVFGTTTEFEREVLTSLLRLRRRLRLRDFGDADPVLASDLRRDLVKPVEKTLMRLVEKGYVKKVGLRYDLRRTFNGKMRRLSWDAPSHTVDTRFGDPRLFLHPSGRRGFTVREAARIQGFPDSFALPKGAVGFRLVGNAVPPPVAAKAAEFIKCGLLS
jgi:DNA (cytosine-5)-methyltransferase 1